MIKIKVMSNEVVTRSGTAKSGKPFSIREQKIRVELNGEVRLTSINLEDSQPPYFPGDYEFDPASILQVGRFGGFEVIPFSHVKLQPIITESKDMSKNSNSSEDVSQTLFGKKNVA